MRASPPPLPPTTWRKVSHAELMERAAAVRERVPESAIADAFLASLSSRRLDWRSALGSWAYVKNLPPHDLDPNPCAYALLCAICGAKGESEEPENPEFLARVLSQTRRGAVGFPDVMWHVQDLEDFASRPPPVLTARDVAIFRDLIEFMGSREDGETSTTLVTALGRAKLLASNKDERAQLVDVLGLCGVLRVPHRPAPLHVFTRGEKKDLPPHHFTDRSYPVVWWRGRDGVNLAVVRALFGHRIPT